VRQADLGIVERLVAQLDALHDEIAELRRALAEARLGATTAQRQLAELRQFMADHGEFGRDFEQYQGVKAAAARDASRRASEEARQRYEQEKARRQVRMQHAREARAQERQADETLAYYGDRGFEPIGLDVYVSRIGYSYNPVDATASRIDYSPGFGNYLRLYPGITIDYSRLTISGSVLNAAADVRNIGIAVTFFDEAGNQVGHETVQVTNARPQVPYPFTSTITMALDRPFASATHYVLYADAPAE
jgi:hypothetical protein